MKTLYLVYNNLHYEVFRTTWDREIYRTSKAEDRIREVLCPDETTRQDFRGCEFVDDYEQIAQLLTEESRDRTAKSEALKRGETVFSGLVPEIRTTGWFTAQEFIALARQNLAELEDDTDSAGGPQMHRRAVVGKNLVVHRHGWDATARGGSGGRTVSIRVDGQYVDQAWVIMPTTATADRLANALNKNLEANPIGLEEEAGWIQ